MLDLRIFLSSCLIAMALSQKLSYFNSNNYKDEVMKSPKKDVQFEQLKIEEIDDFFQQNLKLVSKENLKKFYRKLFNLVIETEHQVGKSYVSHNKIHNFISAGLVAISKEFNLEYEDKKNKEENEFVLATNALDEDKIKSRDFRFKKISHNERQVKTKKTAHEIEMLMKNKILIAKKSVKTEEEFEQPIIDKNKLNLEYLNQNHGKLDYIKNRNNDVHPKFFDDMNNVPTEEFEDLN